MKSGRVVVMETVEGMSEIWFYQDGLIKNKVAMRTHTHARTHTVESLPVLLEDPEKPNSVL